MVKKDRGNSLANSKRDDNRFQVWRPLAEAASLLETVLRVSTRRPRTPLGQSDLNCAEAALDVPALDGSGTAGVAAGVLSNARHLASCSSGGGEWVSNDLPLVIRGIRIRFWRRSNPKNRG